VKKVAIKCGKVAGSDSTGKYTSQKKKICSLIGIYEYLKSVEYSMHRFQFIWVNCFLQNGRLKCARIRDIIVICICTYAVTLSYQSHIVEGM
jgi:hypothetical protein